MRPLKRQGSSVWVIDQQRLPHERIEIELKNVEDTVRAIRDMTVRGAPLIGATAAYGMFFGLREDARDATLKQLYQTLFDTRPTAVNLKWALDRVVAAVRNRPISERADQALETADAIVEDEAAMCRAIGEIGVKLIQEIHQKTGQVVEVLTHCNAGWLGTFDYGTATAPIYLAREKDIPVHVWVDETRPRNQGASLTAWELAAREVPHTLIADNSGGHFMQHGRVDLCFVGADRVTSNGDVCNKIGTYLKALAARDNGVPFYVCLPSSTIDWTLKDGLSEIPIEERSSREVTHLRGRTQDGQLTEVGIAPPGVKVANPAFDVTPARLVTGLITERGLSSASTAGLRELFPSRAPQD